MPKIHTFEELTRSAVEAGGTVHTPNGLPVGMIRHDGAMFECEHGDHGDYLFPVTAELIGEPEFLEGFQISGDETHALIYTDGNIALTLHEACYFLWHLNRDGELLFSSIGGEHRLSVESVEKCIAWHKQHGKPDR